MSDGSPLALPMRLYHYGDLRDGNLANAEFENVVGVRKSFNKPRYPGVLWASPVESAYGWADWCRTEEPTWVATQRWELELMSTARVLVIDTLDDLVRLVAAYPGDETILSDIDWPCVARDYDAVHLTVEGQLQTRFTMPTLYGWDCESLAIFRAADHVRIVGVS